MAHSMYLSGVLGTYNVENPDYMYIKIVSSEPNKSFTTFMVRIQKGSLSDKLKGVPAGSVIGLHNCRLGEPYVTKPFVPKGQTEAIRVTYNHIVHVEDIICPNMQGKTIKQQSFTSQQMDDLVDSLG
jgi:hypothetical protein